MKVIKLFLLCISLLVFVLFIGINQMTAVPGSSSGNGNPALLLVILVIPLFFVMVWLWQRLIRQYGLRRRAIMIGLFLTFIHILAGIIYQRSALTNYRKVIEAALIERYGYADQQYLLDITSGLTIHVNNQYFNVNTFFMLISFSIFIAFIWFVLLAEKNEKKI